MLYRDACRDVATPPVAPPPARSDGTRRRDRPPTPTLAGPDDPSREPRRAWSVGAPVRRCRVIGGTSATCPLAWPSRDVAQVEAVVAQLVALAADLASDGAPVHPILAARLLALLRRNASLFNADAATDGRRRA